MMPEQRQAADMRHFWNVVARHKWAILALALTTSIIAAVVVMAMTPVYRASATILIESQQPNLVSIEEVYGLDTRNLQYYKTQFELLKTRPLVEEVIESLQLQNHPEYSVDAGSTSLYARVRDWIRSFFPGQSTSTRMDPEQERIETYYEHLTIAPRRDTQLVDVHFESEDPALAAEVANGHARAYIQSVLESRETVTDSASTWMLDRLAELQQNLLDSEQRLQEFREQEQLIDAEGLKSLPAREINELTSRLVEVRGELSQARIAYDQVYRGLDVPLRDLSGIPAILDDKGVQDLQQIEAQALGKVAELAKRYGPLHPKMITANAELAKASENLRDQHRSVAEAIKIKYEAAQAEELELQAALNRAKRQYQQIGRKESQLLTLVREGDTNRELYDLFFNRVSEMSATGGLETAPARIISPAVIPAKPSKPKKATIVLLVFLISLLLGITAAFIRESMKNTVRSVADVEETLRVPLLGMVPLLRGRGRKDAALANVYFDRTQPGFKEAIRNVRTGIALDNTEHPHKVIVIASSTSGEGKSTVALNLAYSFAQGEKVLLLDTDMRRPSIGQALKVPDDRPGLAQLLAGDASLAECVFQGGKGFMDLLLPGKIPPDPSQLLSSERLINALMVLRRNYDRIIIDTPPILPVSDGLVLAMHADTVIFVAKSDATSMRHIKQALDLLLRVNARVTGIVVNKLDIRKARKYSDFGYGGYYDLYQAPMAK